MNNDAYHLPWMKKVFRTTQRPWQAMSGISIPSTYPPVCWTLVYETSCSGEYNKPIWKVNAARFSMLHFMATRVTFQQVRNPSVVIKNLIPFSMNILPGSKTSILMIVRRQVHSSSVTWLAFHLGMCRNSEPRHPVCTFEMAQCMTNHNETWYSPGCPPCIRKM